MFGETREFSDQEIAAILAHTRIPTLVIEGKHDLFLFRRIQEEIGAANVSLLAVGGKSCVVKAFRNRPVSNSAPTILFFVDKDEWAFCAIPQEFDDELFETTDGYSIENDLLTDGNVLSLMYPEEREVCEAEMKKFGRWFSVQMARHLRGEDANIAKFVGRILDSEEEFQADCALAEAEQEPTEIEQIVLENPMRNLRGKSLLQIVARQLNAVGRVARHQPKALLESAAAAKGQNYRRILEWVTGAVSEICEP